MEPFEGKRRNFERIGLRRFLGCPEGARFKGGMSQIHPAVERMLSKAGEVLLDSG